MNQLLFSFRSIFVCRACDCYALFPSYTNHANKSFSISYTANVNPEDIELSIKNWRNKHTSDSENKHQFNSNSRTNNVRSDDEYFSHQFTENEESLGVSMYILAVLTLAVVLLFLHWYRRGRNNIRTRRVYNLLKPLGL